MSTDRLLVLTCQASIPASFTSSHNLIFRQTLSLKKSLKSSNRSERDMTDSRPTHGESGVAIARDSAGGCTEGCSAHAGDRTLEGGGPPLLPLAPSCDRQTISRQFLSQAKNTLLPTENYSYKSCIQSDCQLNLPVAYD